MTLQCYYQRDHKFTMKLRSKLNYAPDLDCKYKIIGNFFIIIIIKVFEGIIKR